MTALRERMTQDLILRGLSLNTQAAYLRAVAQLVRYYRRSPERISGREVVAYLLHLYQPASLAFPWRSLSTRKSPLVLPTINRARSCDHATKKGSTCGPSRMMPKRAGGQVIVGYGTNPSGKREAWMAMIPEPGPGVFGMTAVLALAASRKRRAN